MLETRNPVEVLTTLRTAERLLTAQAERLQRHAVAFADFGRWGPSEQCREIVDTAAALGALAAEIATETET